MRVNWLPIYIDVLDIPDNDPDQDRDYGQGQDHDQGQDLDYDQGQDHG